MVLTTYEPVSAALTDISYLPPDQTPYTATSATGQRMTIFHPDGTPADYSDVYGPNATSATRWKTLLVLNLSGNGANGTTSAAPSSSLTSANGILWQALRRGFAVVSAQQTSQAAANTGVTGKGFIHLPGGVQGYYESRNRPSHLKDGIFAIQNIRWNAQSYPVGHPSSYGLSDWIAVIGSNSSFGLPWVCSAPDRAYELGSGGQYNMPTVPNFVFASTAYFYYWLKFLNNEATTGAFFPGAETGGAGVDDVVAATLAAAPARYVRDYAVGQLISDVGAGTHPKVFAFSNTGPEDMNFGEPFIANLRAFATGVHDIWHLFVLKQALPRGWVELRCPPAAAYTLSATQASSTAIPEPFYDGNLNCAVSNYAASTGSVSFAGQPSDGNTITIGDGLTTVTFEYDNNASVTAGNTSITIGASTAQSMTRLLTAITTVGLRLSWTAGVPSTTATNFTSSQGVIAANYTWTKSGANITVTGLTGGVAGTQAFSSEDEFTGFAIGALVRHCNDRRWDETMPATGIRRKSQVNTTGRCIVPPRPDRGYLLLANRDTTDVLYWGFTSNSMDNPVPVGQSVSIPGTGYIWAKAGTDVCAYECREMPVEDAT